MIVTNKRLVKPKSFVIDGIVIETVESFRLLGVTIDDKLSFNEHVSKQCSMIAKKLYMIKRLFYLPFAVKLQFFKSFILPYFDYAISLCIYFRTDIIQKLSKMYYICLFKLFSFKFLNKTHNEVNEFLKEFGLFSFQHRLTFRLVLFANKIIQLNSSPKLLKSWLEPVELCNTRYSLRSNNSIGFTSDKILKKFGDITFKNFFSKFLNKIGYNNICVDFNSLRNNLIHSSLNNYFCILIKIYPKFDSDINFYFYQF
jgi:hypothetical protein